MRDLAWIAFFGGLGSAARYLLSARIQACLETGLPAGTLAVNVLGSLALGMLVGAVEQGLDPRWRLYLGTGFLGGFTTWSAFGVESVRLLEDGPGWVWLGNVAAQLVFGLGAAGLGLWAGRALSGG